jgi:hypothetical protein
MQLAEPDCRLFYALHPALMWYANEQLGVLPDKVSTPERFASLPPEKRVKVRDALHAQPGLIDAFVRANPCDLSREELEVIESWKHAVVGGFYIFRYLTHYTVFLGSENVPRAYGVLALVHPIEDLIGPYLPRLVETVLLPFRGKIVYDGLLSGYNITFGGGVKRSLNESYREAKNRFGIITSLPFDAEEPAPEKKSKSPEAEPARPGRAPGTSGAGAKGAATFPLRLTAAQRKAVARILPDLAARLDLDLPNERTRRFTLDEIETIARAARAAMPKAHTGMERNSLRHVVDATRRATKKYGAGKIHRLPAAQRIYQFKITLKGIEPPIWRRIQVKDCTLDRFHEHIQTSMGWTNSHLHEFNIGGDLYGDPHLLLEGDEDDPEIISSLETRLSEVVPEDGRRFRFEYEYDFGDGWQHEVLFEGCLLAQKGGRYPLCVEGERACPPEDVGGIDGYQRYLEAIGDPEDDEHDAFLEWRGPFDPETFDPTAASKRMRRGRRHEKEDPWG